jgi:hypothetical protein
MPVVINEFEVVSEDQRAARPAGGEAPATAETGSRAGLEPCAVASALRTLEAQALRVWAH